jgi:hypothetical protein
MSEVSTPTEAQDFIRPQTVPEQAANRIVTMLSSLPSTELFTGEGRSKKLSETVRTFSADTFHALIEDATVSEIEELIADLRQRHRAIRERKTAGDRERQFGSALTKMANSLQFRLSHYMLGHQIKPAHTIERFSVLLEPPPEQPAATPLPEVLVEEAVQVIADAEEETGYDQVLEPEPATEPVSQLDAVEDYSPAQAERPEEAIAVVTPHSTAEVEVSPAQTNPHPEVVTREAAVADQMIRDPLFTRGFFSVPADYLRNLAGFLEQRMPDIETTGSAYQQLSWWRKKLNQGVTPEMQTHLQRMRDSLGMIYPSMDQQMREMRCRQLATVFNGLEKEYIDYSMLAASVRMIELLEGQESVSVPSRRRIQEMESRRGFMRAAAVGGAALAGAALFGPRALEFLSRPSTAHAGPDQSSEQPTPLPEPVSGATAGQEASEAARLAEQNRQVEAARQAEIAEVARREEEERLTAQQREAERAEAERQEQARLEQERLEQERQAAEQRAAEAKRAELKEEVLGSIMQVSGRGFALAGVEGNFTGTYSAVVDPQEVSTTFSDEQLAGLGELRRLFHERYATCNGNMTVRLPPHSTAVFRVADHDKTRTGELTDTIQVPVSQEVPLEVSGIEVVDGKVLLRLENTYVGDGKVGADGKSGAVFIETSLEESKSLLENAQKGTSVVFFAVGSNAYRTNAGNAMRLIADHVHTSPGRFDAIQTTLLNLPASQQAEKLDLYDVGYVMGRAVQGPAMAGGGCGGFTPMWNLLLRTLESQQRNFTVTEHQNHSTGGYMPGIAKASSERYGRDIWRDATMAYYGAGSQVNGVVEYPGTTVNMQFQKLFEQNEPYNGRELGAALFVASGSVM